MSETTDAQKIRLGVLTSGGDAPGMNAAVRAVVRTAITRGAEVFAIYEGYQGMIEGGAGIRRFGWDDVSSILHRGGTVIGTYRSPEFRTREGRLRAARNLVEQGIDRLVVIGGDGSLTGLNMFSQEWPELLADLVAAGELSQEQVDRFPQLRIAGMVGSIDNDLVGVDSTIGADTALHRIIEAIDAITSTAASHQRSFVIEVMGRHCGYLPLMAAVAAGCDYVFIPECPPEEGWEEKMCAQLKRGRERGRRDSLVLVAEGAQDRAGNPITAEQVRQIIADSLNEDVRVTILGHVQRGGRPSAYDRWASTWLGYETVNELLRDDYDGVAKVIGIKGNSVIRLPLLEAIGDTKQVPKMIEAGDYQAAIESRGVQFESMLGIFREFSEPTRLAAEATAKRIAIIHGGGLAPGMNAAAGAAVRLGINRGYQMLGVQSGFPGLVRGDIRELAWDDVEGWSGEGGAYLGVQRTIPETEDLYAISRALEDNQVDGLLIIGGWNAYQAAYLLHTERNRYPAFQIPIVCVPASIDNNLPGTELSIGSDTALNINSEAIDMIKQSGMATTRCFIVETMGRYCGYLAMMSGISVGAERIYLNEDEIRLKDLAEDVEWLQESFDHGRRFFLAVRNEEASKAYTTEFIGRMLQGAAHGRYDVRTQIIGHIQQGAAPSVFDRLLATQLASFALDTLEKEFGKKVPTGRYVGLRDSRPVASPLAYMPDEMDLKHRRPVEQWWLELKPVHDAVSSQLPRHS